MTSPLMNQILYLNEMSMSSSVVLSVVALSGKSVFTKHSVSSGWMNENTAKRVTRTTLIGVLQMRYPTADPMWNLFNLNTFFFAEQILNNLSPEIQLTLIQILGLNQDL